MVLSIMLSYEVWKLYFYHYGAEIPIEEVPFQMAIPNGHWESFYDHIW